MFVDVELPVSMRAALTVPLDVVIDSGQEQRVFVERESGVFEPRKVRTGWHLGDQVEIVEGLKEGESVVFFGNISGRFGEPAQNATECGERTARPASRASESSSESGIAASNGKVKDAACGMTIDKAQSIAEVHTLTRHGVTYYFCSDRCKRKFSEQPDHYLAANPSGHRS